MVVATVITMADTADMTIAVMDHLMAIVTAVVMHHLMVMGHLMVTWVAMDHLMVTVMGVVTTKSFSK